MIYFHKTNYKEERKFMWINKYKYTLLWRKWQEFLSKRLKIKNCFLRYKFNKCARNTSSMEEKWDNDGSLHFHYKLSQWFGDSFFLILFNI
jgi:hypothetical protein